MAQVVIPIKSKSQLKNIYKAEDYLVKAGIMFDRGHEMNPKTGKLLRRIWELDWSLIGAKVKRS